jgi:uncharacterized protein YktA (UPF0223 family)
MVADGGGRERFRQRFPPPLPALKNMTKEEIKELLKDVFKETDDGKIVFNQDYLNPDNQDKYTIYQAISKAKHASNLSFDFSYLVADKAVGILTDLEVEEWENDEKINEMVDGCIPIYTSDLIEIYQSDSWAVNEARKEFGVGKDCETEAQLAWYQAIKQMTYEIVKNLFAIADTTE